MSTLNGPDSTGRTSLIRDIRSGNAADGDAGALTDFESPVIVADLTMGISNIQSAAAFTGDASQSGYVITVEKRASQVAIRGRIPFVDGGLNTSTDLPGGPAEAPTQQPLRSGDSLWQDVPTASGETVRVRAEILLNEDVINDIGGLPALGRTPAGDDGGALPTAHLRVSAIDTGRDSDGNPVSFIANSTTIGQDCTVRVHYYQNVPYVGSAFEVSDSGRRYDFVSIEPVVPLIGPSGPTRGPGSNPSFDLQEVNPMAAIGVRFSEPIDQTVVDPHNNLVLSNDEFHSVGTGPTKVVGVEELLLEPKPAGLGVIGSRLVDQDGDGTLLRLAPPLGLFHEANVEDAYWLHVVGGDGGPKDLSGNPLDLFDRQLFADGAFSMRFGVAPLAAENLVGSRVMRFEDFDEDGTMPGSEDYFGQFTLGAGRLGGAVTQRTRLLADRQNLSAVTRADKSECWASGAGVPPTVVPGGVLYQCPNNILMQPAPPAVFIPPPPPLRFGGILEPHNPRGSRLQMTYREDDFAMSYTDKNQMNLDLEQLHWASWTNQEVQFDVFDKITIEASHSDWRPDVQFWLDPAATSPSPCVPHCDSMNSGLRNDFASNVLRGTTPTTIVNEKVYTINPNEAFTAQNGTKYVPYAKFDRSYTWRDSRLVSWDMSVNQATGLGGAKQPNGTPPAVDLTAHVSSPWIQEPPSAFANPSVVPFTGFQGEVWTGSLGDFSGSQARDHDPIALPLLLDFKVFPDDPQNGVASGSNRFHIGYVGACWSIGGGYYNVSSLLCNGINWPTLRVHSSGGITGQGLEQFVDPSGTTQASGGWIFDAGLGDPNGRYQTTAHNVTGSFGDDHVHWAAADFVRKVSLVTFGFFDSQLPNRHDLASITPAFSEWPGLSNSEGLPDFAALGASRGVAYAATDMLLVQDPPAATQPAGTSVVVELRGAGSFDQSDTIWDKPNEDSFDQRGNLLNPNYACEAYRYATPNSGGGTPRIAASGLTPYRIEKDLDDIRSTSGQLPRYMNVRITFENDVVSEPSQTPFLRSLVVAYRMAEQ